MATKKISGLASVCLLLFCLAPERCFVEGEGLRPVISVPPSNVTVFRQETVILSCTVGDEYDAAVKWFNGSVEVVKSSRIRIGSSTKRLYILNAEENDTAWYTCTAANQYGLTSAKAYVQVLGDVPPIITLSPENATVHNGQDHFLSCQGKSSPAPSYNWLHNGGVISDPYIIQTGGDLQIAGVETRHKGWYTCVIKNDFGSVAAKAYIDVVKDPTIITDPKSMFGYLGKEVNIDCTMSASWKNIKVIWRRDGWRVSQDDRIVYRLRQDNEVVIATLQIKVLQTSDEGEYNCEVINDHGFDSSGVGVLTVIDPPKIKVEGHEVVAWKRRNATIQCEASGIPLPEISWIIGKQQLNESALPMLRITRQLPSKNTVKSILNITEVGASDEGTIKCRAENFIHTAEESFQLKVIGEPEPPWAVTANLTSETTVAVSWNGGHQGGDVPYYTVNFKHKDSNRWEKDVTDKGQHIIYLTGKRDWQNFEIKVIAVNKYGKSQPSELVSVTGYISKAPSQHSVVVIASAIGALAFVLLLVVIGLLVYLRKRRPKQPNDINNVSYTVVDQEHRIDLGPQGRLYGDDDGAYASLQSLNEAEDGFYSTIPAGVDWEIPRKDLKIEKILGEGNFGQVVKAVLSKENKKDMIVAVKMLKDGHSKKDYEDFLKELDLMKSMKPHPNVVSLIGCCTKGGNPYIIVEFLPNGNLREYLKANRAGQSDMYSNLAPFCKTLTSSNLVTFAWQIARGMSFLAGLKLVHRDLAARNVLLTKDICCKISDFGLARDIYEDDLYQRTTMGHLPLRWMAYESVFNGVSTVESDVWSFGILLWEIVTLGATPYPYMGRDELLAGLVQGYRMPKPPHCADELYAVMVECWQQDPKDRPTFFELAKTFHRIKEAQQVWVDLKNYDENEYYNANEVLLDAKTGRTLSKSKETLNMVRCDMKKGANNEAANSVQKKGSVVAIKPEKGKNDYTKGAKPADV